MLKCPHCNGFLAIIPTRQVELDSADTLTRNRILTWIDERLPLPELLGKVGVDDFTRYEPLDRECVLTAFRSRQCIEYWGLSVTDKHFARIMRTIPGWSESPTARVVFGKQARYWVRDGYEYEPGYTEDDIII